MNGAYIGASAGRPGNVLQMIGAHAGADAGNFYGHNLKYVVIISLTIIVYYLCGLFSWLLFGVFKLSFIRNMTKGLLCKGEHDRESANMAVAI